MMAKKRARKSGHATRTRKVKRVSPRTSRKVSRGTDYVYPSIRRIDVALRNLFLFLILAVISYILYTVLNNSLFSSLFSLLTIMFAFVALAFFIVLLVFLALKLAKKSTVGEFPAPKKTRARRSRRRKR
jgi:membrane glycosyltransferase